MGSRLGAWIACFNILAVCGVLLGAFGVQFGEGEFPCPLCIMQRMAMLLCTLGPAYILVKARQGEADETVLATGYGLSVLAALGGATIAGRQILLHIMPGDPGFGAPVMGLHLYTWSFLVFATVLIVSGLNLVFARVLAPRNMSAGLLSTLVLGLLAAVILANALTVLCIEGLHWTLPGHPSRYELFHDLGWHGQE